MTARSRIEKYAECGAFGHAWFETPDYDWRPSFGVPIVLRCERCLSERHDAINTRGDVEQRHYKYSPDYTYKGETRPTRNDFRKAVLRKRKSNVVKLRARKNA